MRNLARGLSGPLPGGACEDQARGVLREVSERSSEEENGAAEEEEEEDEEEEIQAGTECILSRSKEFLRAIIEEVAVQHETQQIVPECAVAGRNNSLHHNWLCGEARATPLEAKISTDRRELWDTFCQPPLLPPVHLIALCRAYLGGKVSIHLWDTGERLSFSRIGGRALLGAFGRELDS
jgi:hypothetical protein